MIRRPPRSTRTDTLFPYTTLFRSLRGPFRARAGRPLDAPPDDTHVLQRVEAVSGALMLLPRALRSEEHTSELQSLMRISYAVFCLTKKKTEENTISLMK